MIILEFKTKLNLGTKREKGTPTARIMNLNNIWKIGYKWTLRILKLPTCTELNRSARENRWRKDSRFRKELMCLCMETKNSIFGNFKRNKWDSNWFWIQPNFIPTLKSILVWLFHWWMNMKSRSKKNKKTRENGKLKMDSTISWKLLTGMSTPRNPITPQLKILTTIPIIKILKIAKRKWKGSSMIQNKTESQIFKQKLM